MSELEPIEPAEAVEMWLDHQRSERAASTLQSYSYRLAPFVEWCQRNAIHNLNDLTSRDVYRYESERRGEDLAISTLNNQIGTVKRFLAFCERIEAVPEDLPTRIEVPTSDEFSEMVNETKLSRARATEILDELGRYEYASRRHAMFLLLWHTGCRIGGLVALDLDDLYFHKDDLERLRHRDDIDEDVLEEVDLPFLFFQHRPDAKVGTPLKNKRAGQRPVALADHVAELVEDYIQVNRVDREDPDGRRPLFTTEHGDYARVSGSSVRREIYIVTQPCRYGECPHDRDPDDCEATERDGYSKCPSARSPHDVRSGAITAHLLDDVPVEIVSDRMDVSQNVLDKHYDRRTEREKMEQRRDYLRGK